MKIFVTAKPRAKKEEVEKIDDIHYHVAVVEPPMGGEANHAVIKALSVYLKIRPNKIIMISGFNSRQKIFQIDN
ncbi:MAG: DUF167 domain-containing protein [Candidatus Levybacteria bacterium]|nr:DUF167 domain-containing protein [Candidatus Levybacteria bacterium]